MKRPHLSNRTIITILLAQLLLAALAIQIIRSPRQASGVQKVTRTEFLMTTIVEGTVYTADVEQGNDALTAAYQEAARLEGILDRNRPGSDVAKVNAAAGDVPVPVSRAAFDVVKLALDVARLTDGAFDITIAPLIELWGFGTGNVALPAQSDLLAALQLVDFNRVRLNEEEETVFLDTRGMKLDLGGIAKGFIVDRAVDALIAEGVTSASFDAGGDIRVIGTKPDGALWKIGIRNPRDRNKIIAAVELRDQAVVTSGDYERFVIEDGERYHHILDPETGLPTRGLTSVTVIAKDAFTADALSTAVFVLGKEKGMSLIESMPEVEAVIITEGGEILTSSGLEGKVTLL